LPTLNFLVFFLSGIPAFPWPGMMTWRFKISNSDLLTADMSQDGGEIVQDHVHQNVFGAGEKSNIKSNKTEVNAGNI
jgi:hypothetical protein